MAPTITRTTQPFRHLVHGEVPLELKSLVVTLWPFNKKEKKKKKKVKYIKSLTSLEISENNYSLKLQLKLQSTYWVSSLKKKKKALLKVWNKLNSLSLSPINNHNKIFQFLKWFPIFLFLNYGFLYGCQENINASFYGLGSMVKKIFLKFIHNYLTITKF